MKHHWKKLLVAVAAAVGIGASAAYAAECWDCIPCVSLPDGSVGTCCNIYPC